MKVIIALVAAVIPMVLSYDEKYDNVDIDKVLDNDELFGKYIDCWMDKGPCDMKYAEDYKQLLPEIISTACSKCSPIQKQHLRKTVKAFADKRPKDLTAFRQKYDPKAEYEAAFAAFLMSTD